MSTSPNCNPSTDLRLSLRSLSSRASVPIAESRLLPKNKPLKTLLLVPVLLLFYGCATPNQALLDRKQAEVLGAQAGSVGETVRKSIGLLVSLRNNINIQGRSLTRKELDFVATASQLEERFLAWNALPSPKEGKNASAAKKHLSFQENRLKQIQDLELQAAQLLFQKIN